MNAYKLLYMTHIRLNDKINKEELIDFLKKQEDLNISIEETFDTSFLDILNNSINSRKRIKLNIFLNEFLPVDIWKYISNIDKLLIHSSYEVPLKNIEFLKDFKSLTSLELTGDCDKKTLSFRPIEHIDTLIHFTFVRGLTNTNQYKFLNQQQKLESLEVGNIDIGLVTKNQQLKTLRVNSVFKSENLISEKFPNLIDLHLHGCSRLTNHTFISRLKKIESINISYNRHITEFPKIINPELVKTIEMFTCPNFSSIDSLLQFQNLERLVLTSYDKPLQVPIQDFEKLKQLKKLTTVYTAWGQRPVKDLEFISDVYKTTKWQNSQYPFPLR